MQALHVSLIQLYVEVGVLYLGLKIPITDRCRDSKYVEKYDTHLKDQIHQPQNGGDG